MKKRTAAILMTLVMLFSVVTTALGEEKWTCLECGKRNAVSMGDICPYCGTHRHIHTWQDATCTEPRTCTGCGETEGEPAGHDWDDGVVTKAATCVNEGNMTYTCTTCGETKQKTIEKNEIHTWQDATCTEPRTCTGCGETEGEPAGHDWDDGVVTKAATCVNEGNMTYTCTTCGETKQETIEKNENNHAAETEVRGYKEATCVEDGYSGDVYCKGCEAMIKGGETIAATGEHEWDEATYNAPKTCRVCGATEGEPLVLKVGDYITYGTYPQTAAGNDSTPIEWLVLEYDAKNNKALLISRYGLDCQPYNSYCESVTWETCSLRTWLNGTFLNKAFSKAEQGAILTTNVDNNKSQCYCGWWTPSGGNNTQDKIFLLSYAEANKYFNVEDGEKSSAEDNIKSRVAPTAYAIAQGAYTNSSRKTADGSASGRWWLRSPGDYRTYAADVDHDGSLYDGYVSRNNLSVRPAFWLDLSGI